MCRCDAGYARGYWLPPKVCKITVSAGASGLQYSWSGVTSLDCKACRGRQGIISWFCFPGEDDCLL